MTDRAVFVNLLSHAAHRALWLPVAGLVVVTAILISPCGDFPLNDDWIYAKSVQWTLEQGWYAGHPLGMATMVAHVLWGALWVSVFGFSFTVLRVSTLLLAGVALWAVARAVRECGGSRAVALIAALVLWSNPIVLNLSYTFMTDVPFLALTALSTWFFLRALRAGKPGDIACGSCLAALSLFVRQFGVLTAIAFAIAWVVTSSKGRNRPTVSGIVAFLVPLGIAGLGWLWWIGNVENLFTSGPTRSLGETTAGAPWYGLAAAFYLGLFLLPLACATLWEALAGKERWTLTHWVGLAACVVVTGLCLGLAAEGWRVPPLPNVLRNLGVGPLTLKDAAGSPDWSPVQLGTSMLWVVTAVSLLSTCVLVVSAWFRREATSEPDNGRAGQFLFLAVATVLFIVGPYNPWIPFVYDRHLLPVLVPAIVLCIIGIRLEGRGALVAALVPCLAMLVFSVCSLQDYMAWNRARWTAIERVLEARVAPFEIDGGYEYNGMYTSDEFARRHNAPDFRQKGPLGWWVLDDTYAIAFRDRPGFDEVDRVNYFSWLRLGDDCIRILRRADSPGGPGS